jgi:hypothetical protein
MEPYNNKWENKTFHSPINKVIFLSSRLKYYKYNKLIQFLIVIFRNYIIIYLVLLLFFY